MLSKSAMERCDTLNCSKAMERNEAKLREADPRINQWYDVLSQRSPRRAGSTVEDWCFWIHTIAQARADVFLEVYQRRQHRNWKFRAFAMRQRAEEMIVNRLARRCREEEWETLHNRIQPRARKTRPQARRQNGVPSYPTDPCLFAWGDRSCDPPTTMGLSSAIGL